MKIFIICTVREATPSYKEALESYTRKLEGQGHTVHLPHRDTDQTQTGYWICTQNMNAIKGADEVHIFYNSTSQGTHFDMGVAFSLGKKLVVVESPALTPGKSYQNMLAEWANIHSVAETRSSASRGWSFYEED